MNNCYCTFHQNKYKKQRVDNRLEIVNELLTHCYDDAVVDVVLLEAIKNNLEKEKETYE